MYIVRYGMCVCICMFVGEHVCRPSLLCNPVYDKIDNNNNNNNNQSGVLQNLLPATKLDDYFPLICF